jgi:hypothetical protein
MLYGGGSGIRDTPLVLCASGSIPYLVLKSLFKGSQRRADVVWLFPKGPAACSEFQDHRNTQEIMHEKNSTYGGDCDGE